MQSIAHFYLKRKEKSLHRSEQYALFVHLKRKQKENQRRVDECEQKLFTAWPRKQINTGRPIEKKRGKQTQFGERLYC